MLRKFCEINFLASSHAFLLTELAAERVSAAVIFDTAATLCVSSITDFAAKLVTALSGYLSRSGNLAELPSFLTPAMPALANHGNDLILCVNFYLLYFFVKEQLICFFFFPNKISTIFDPCKFRKLVCYILNRFFFVVSYNKNPIQKF